jgi:dolichyldiphosphatase
MNSASIFKGSILFIFIFIVISLLDTIPPLQANNINSPTSDSQSLSSNFQSSISASSSSSSNICQVPLSLPCTSYAALSNSTLTPLTFTYVLYSTSSYLKISKLLAYLTFLPIVFGITLLSIAFSRRDLDSIYLTLGLIFSTLINSVIKHTIKQPRPQGSFLPGYGMPSDHSQFSWFITVYFLLFVYFHIRSTRSTHNNINNSNKHTNKSKSTSTSYAHLPFLLPNPGFFRFFSIFVFIVTTLIVCYSRIHLGVHSWEQVLAGTSAGIVIGTIWFFLGHYFVFPNSSSICHSELLKSLRIKDIRNIPQNFVDYLDYEYSIYDQVSAIIASDSPQPFLQSKYQKSN